MHEQRSINSGGGVSHIVHCAAYIIQKVTRLCDNRYFVFFFFLQKILEGSLVYTVIFRLVVSGGLSYLAVY